MKRILGILVIFSAFLFTGLMAQDAVVDRNGTNFTVYLTSADVVEDTDTLDKVIDVSTKQSVQLYCIQVSLDSVTGTPAHTTTLDGSVDNSFYTNISTVSWAGSSEDTSFVFSDISTGVPWSYMRVRIIGSSSSDSQLTKLKGRFFDEVK